MHAIYLCLVKNKPISLKIIQIVSPATFVNTQDRVLTL